MTQERWTAVEAYFNETLIGEDGALDHALVASRGAGLPDIHVSAALGKFLQMLAQIQGAKRILEIGTLAGYSTIWLARALPDDGTVVSLEVNPEHARVARENIEYAALGDRVEIRVGKAVDSLAAMVDAGEDPFDFVFIDADKPSNPAYLEGALRLSRHGTLIVVDNVVRNGAVADASSTSAEIVGVRTMVAGIAANPRLTATANQTVGVKGYDGFALIRVG